MIDYLKLADHSWPLLRHVMGAHALLYRATGGRLGQRLPGVPPMLLLDHVGARSATRRTTPLVYMPDGQDFVIVAAKGGHPRDPAWLHNVRANPDTDVQVGASKIAVRATEADVQERRRLWPRAVEYNPLWDRYQARTRREIPLVILRPRAR